MTRTGRPCWTWPRRSSPWRRTNDPKANCPENFLSFGEPASEFEFVDGELLWVLCEPNGIGKSAVFDAITYVLFGEHRGGKQKAEQLIRHGANGFEVEFDFEFDGI